MHKILSTYLDILPPTPAGRLVEMRVALVARVRESRCRGGLKAPGTPWRNAAGRPDPLVVEIQSELLLTIGARRRVTDGIAACGRWIGFTVAIARSVEGLERMDRQEVCGRIGVTDSISPGLWKDRVADGIARSVEGLGSCGEERSRIFLRIHLSSSYNLIQSGRPHSSFNDPECAIVGGIIGIED